MLGLLSLLFLSTLSAQKTSFDQCVRGIQRMLYYGLIQVPAKNNWSRMYEASSFRVNVLGDMNKCNDLPNASYALIHIAIFGYGICGPEACTQDDYLQILHDPSVISNGIGDLPIKPFENWAKMMSDQIKQNKENNALLWNQDLLREHQTLSDPVLFPSSFISEQIYPFTWGFYTMTIITVILGTIALIATLIDMYMQYWRKSKSKWGWRNHYEVKCTQINFDVVGKEAIDFKSLSKQQQEESPNKLLQMLLCFSVNTNLIKLMNRRTTQDHQIFDIFNGIRAMSVGWVIIGHTVLFDVEQSPIYNYRERGTFFRDDKNGLVFGGVYGIQVFFWISGFVITFMLISQLNKFNGFTGYQWFMVFFTKLYRIFPIYMYIFFFVWAYNKHFGYGPYWPVADTVCSLNDCRQYWWTNMIFLNNFIPDWQGNRCEVWTWYQADDMQFFIATLFIIFVYYKVSKSLGWGIITTLIYVTMVCGFFLARHYDLVAGGADPPGVSSFTADYNKPYTRCTSWLLGVLCAIICYSKRCYDKKKEIYDPLALWFAKITDNLYVRWFFYCAGSVLMSIFVFEGQYKDLQGNQSNSWTNEGSWFWKGCSRQLWILGFSLVIFPFLIGHGFFVRQFLGASFWTPLARLSYSAYLIHYSTCVIIVYSRQQGPYLQSRVLFIDCMVTVFVTFIAALPISLLVEMPTLALERLLFRNNRVT